jgi:predicted Zn-dependent peptidase
VYTKSALEYLTERNGINVRAATSRVHTGFWAQSEGRQVPTAIDVICQMVLNPTITAEAVAGERETILLEAAEVSRDFLEVLMDKLMEVSFPTSPLGRPILGTKQTIRSLSLRQIQDHYDRFFNPSNCTFACATRLPHDRIVDLVRRSTWFVKKKPDINIDEIDKSIDVRFKGGVRSWVNPSADRTWFAISIPAPAPTSGLFTPWYVMKSAIGHVDPLQPFTQSLLVRQKEITQLMSYYNCLRLTSVLSLMGACRPGDEDRATKGAFGALSGATWDIQPDTLQAAKLQLKSTLARGLSDTRTVAEELALHLLNWGKWRSLEE